MNSEIVHMDESGGYNTAGNVHLDPDVVRDHGVPMSTFVEAALVRRWNSIVLGVCLCGGRLRMLNRKERRDMKRARVRIWDGLMVHRADCPAVSTAVSHFIINRPRSLR